MPGLHTIRRPENCRWGAPACWPDAMSDRDDDFKALWICERADTGVTADDCAHCPYWSPEPARRPVKIRRR